MSALQPPLGGDESHQSGLIAMEVICVVVAGLCVALRCYFRLYHTHSFGWDDYMILIALVFISRDLCSLLGFDTNTFTGLQYCPGRGLYFSLSVWYRSTCLLPA